MTTQIDLAGRIWPVGLKFDTWFTVNVYWFFNKYIILIKNKNPITGTGTEHYHSILLLKYFSHAMYCMYISWSVYLFFFVLCDIFVHLHIIRPQKKVFHWTPVSTCWCSTLNGCVKKIIIPVTILKSFSFLLSSLYPHLSFLHLCPQAMSCPVLSCLWGPQRAASRSHLRRPAPRLLWQAERPNICQPEHCGDGGRGGAGEEKDKWRRRRKCDGDEIKTTAWGGKVEI